VWTVDAWEQSFAEKSARRAKAARRRAAGAAAVTAVMLLLAILLMFLATNALIGVPWRQLIKAAP
jgi:hypothetical protein